MFDEVSKLTFLEINSEIKTIFAKNNEMLLKSVTLNSRRRCHDQLKISIVDRCSLILL